MNASTKKLLSMLVVMAMVFSMVPTFTLPAVATETEPAAQTKEIVYGSANLTTEQAAEVQRGKDVQTAANAIVIPAEGTTFKAECPVCKTTVTWTKSTGAIGTKTAAESYHYYWTGTIAGTGYNWISTNGGNKTKVCLLMRDAVSNGGNAIYAGGTDCEINIMGTGTITSDGTASEGFGMLKVGGTNTKLNLYGGTFIYTGNNLKDTTVQYAALNVNAATCTANLYADVVIGKAAVDTTVANYNALVHTGTLNMYGGTIQNGITGNANRSGNVTITSANGRLNMYGGTIKDGQYTGSPAFAGSNVRIDNAGYFDMYGGTISGGKTRNGGAGGSVYLQAGGANKDKCIANLMGGTITGGESYSYGGNIGGWRGIINIGGTILISDGKLRLTTNSGANIYLPDAPITVNITGGKISGGSGSNGGSIYLAKSTQNELNISGGIITGGSAKNGGNIYVSAGCKFTMTGGTISDGTATNVGGNVYFADAKTLAGGTISGGSAANGGNMAFATTITVNGTSFEGGTATNSAGSIYVPVDGTLELTQGAVNGGTADGAGGNILVDVGGTLNVGANASITNGTSKAAASGSGGGNVYLSAGSKMTTSGTITGGLVDGGEKMLSSGGNINVAASGDNYATLTVNGGVIANGELKYSSDGQVWGANIRSYNSKVVINGGLIYGTKSSTIKPTINVAILGGTNDKANACSYFEMNGGVIVGDVATGAVASGTTSGTDNQYTYTCEYKFTGSPKIVKSYTLENGTTVTARQYGLTVNVPVDISGLESGAEIVVSNGAGKVLTIADENAANVAGCFTTDGSNTKVEAQADNTLKVVEKAVEEPTKDKFEPEKFDGEAYCPVCDDFVTWTPYAGENYSEATVLKNGPHHLYLADDVTYESGKSFLVAWTNVCLNLNGHDITAVEGAKYTFSVSQTLNIIDTEGGAVVTGYNNSKGTGATLHANGGNASSKYNLYGGTYTKLATDTQSAIVQIGGNGGTITMYEGATIDASGKSVSSNAVGCAVQLAGNTGKNAVFNMEGGEIIGGTGVNGGAVQIGAYSDPQIYDCAIFNMKGGEIHSGTATTAGGNFSVQYGGTLNISGGSLYNGHVSSNTEGGNWGGNIRAWNANVNISGGLIYGGTGGKQLNGANVSVYSDADNRTAGRGKLTISGGTIVGDVAITNGAGEGFLTLSGAPKIVTSMEIDGETVSAVVGGLYISGYKAGIADLSPEADIAVSASENLVITYANANAANVAGCFKPTNSALIVEAQADNTLKVVKKVVEVPKVDKFEPEKFDGMAYCPVCYEKGKHTEPVEWTAITSSTAAFQLSQNGHYYIKEDITNATKGSKDAYIQGASGASNICCLNLNGKELTVTDGRAIFASTAVFNIMDTEGGAVVSGNQTTVGNACALLLNASKAGSTVNIYGGTFTKPATNTKSSIVMIGGNGGTINMYGGCIDGTGCTTDNYPTGVYLLGGIYDATNYPHNGLATFNMYGGEIKGGTVATTLNASNKVVAGNGGNILVGDYNSAAVRKGCATFNMYGGSVYGGHADSADNNNGGGNIALYNGGVMNMYNDAKVYGGTAGNSENLKGNAGNILVNTNCTLNMYDNSEVYNGSAGNQAGNIRIWKGDFNMYGNAKVYGGHAYGAATHNIWVVCSDMTMTDNAVVYGKGTTSSNAISISPYGTSASDMIISTLTLSGNATVKNETGVSNNSIGLNWGLTNNADASDDGAGKLFITNDWTGEAHIYAQKNNGVAEGASKTTLASYTAGSTIAECTAVCGTLAQDGTFTKGGSFSGKLYFSGNIGTLAENGDVIIGAVSINGADGDSWYKSNQAALDAYYANGSFAKNEHLVVGGDTTMTMNGDIIIESRGYTVTLDGTGTVYMLDRANDDYEGYGLWKISGDVKVASEATNAVNGNRYISIKSDGGYTAHRFEMKLTHITLRTNAGGMYYKAKIMCDNALAGRVKGYGVVVSRQDMPGADFMDEAEGSNGFTMYEKLVPNAEHTVTTTSGSLFNIVKDPSVVVEGEKVRTPEQNDANIEEKVYANLYLSVDRLDTGILDDCEYFVADNKNCGTQNGIAFSLLDVVSMINDNWSAYSETQQTLVKSTITTWGSWLTSAKANALVAELDKIFA